MGGDADANALLTGLPGEAGLVVGAPGVAGPTSVEARFPAAMPGRRSGADRRRGSSMISAGRTDQPESGGQHRERDHPSPTMTRPPRSFTDLEGKHGGLEGPLGGSRGNAPAGR